MSDDERRRPTQRARCQAEPFDEGARPVDGRHPGRLEVRGLLEQQHLGEIRLVDEEVACERHALPHGVERDARVARISTRHVSPSSGAQARYAESVGSQLSGSRQSGEMATIVPASV